MSLHYLAEANLGRVLEGRQPNESLWWYECDVAPLVGVVAAVDEDAAMAAAVDEANTLAGAYLDKGTWSIRRLEP